MLPFPCSRPSLILPHRSPSHVFSAAKNQAPADTCPDENPTTPLDVVGNDSILIIPDYDDLESHIVFNEQAQIWFTRYGEDYDRDVAACILGRIAGVVRSWPKFYAPSG